MSSIIVVPPMPVGNPDGMEELAGVLDRVAAQLGSLADHVDGLPGGMVFDGPAGDRFRAKVHTDGSRMTTVGGRLKDDAGRLKSAAADVRRQIAAREAALQRLREEHPTAVFKELP